MKILHLDVETSPHTAFVWGLFKETVPIQRLIETGRVMCFSAKWHGKPLMFFSEWEEGHVEMIQILHALLDEADVVVHYNGNRFDMPVINSEFVHYEIAPPSPYKNIDLFRITKSTFRYPSYKLDYVAQKLGLGKKTKHPGFELWVDCMNGVASAQNKMKTYNKQDVALLERLYKRLLPWIYNHPNAALYKDKLTRPVCTNCGSVHIQSRGTYHTKTMCYQRYHCQSCGKWMRSRKNTNSEDKKNNTLVSIR